MQRSVAVALGASLAATVGRRHSSGRGGGRGLVSTKEGSRRTTSRSSGTRTTHSTTSTAQRPPAAAHCAACGPPLQRTGLRIDSVKGGCCGLAGSWGFEKGKYDISLECGKQAYLPAARRAAPETLIVANGFSCQTQLEDAPGTDRTALHLAQVMRLAHDHDPLALSRRPAPPWWQRVARTVGPLAVAGCLTAAARRRRR